MGKTRRQHNAKARQVFETKVDQSEQDKISVDIQGLKSEQYDESNALALPSKKRRTKVIQDNAQVVKKLSKKQRKRLEKVIDQREKKAKRVDILAALQKVQATDTELALLTSTSEMQTRRYKRQLEQGETQEGQTNTNAISGSNKRRKTKALDNESSDESLEQPTGEQSMSESDTSDEEEEEEEEESLKDITRSGQSSIDISSENTQALKKIPDTCLPGQSTSKESMTDTGLSHRKTINIPVNRTNLMQEQRLRLPILGEEQVIMEAINEKPIVVLCGETGSGKTTQVPQFLYEAGYAHGGGIIGMTQPRRVAAITMSKRVAEEMNLTQSVISYQIRYEGNVSDKTKIKFMTDGVLLKEVQKDFLLSRYSVIIIDEAHERSVYTDILIGLLSRIVPLRHKKGNPLKLIIMSATLRVEDFTENPRLFKEIPPVIKVESRQFPVTTHFNKRTPEDYLGETYRKVCKIHRQLPEGGILVFVTGQQEVHTLCAKLRASFPANKPVKDHDPKDEKSETEEPESTLPEVSLDDYSAMPLDEEAELQVDDDKNLDLGLSGEEDVDEGERDLDKLPVSRIGSEQPLHVLPLYSLLASDKQARVFQPPPEGHRLCVVATNVAETSITIPNIKYVIDTGKVKTKFYDKVTGVSTFKVTWTSQAASNQRAGRAGRTAPGHCYRLFSSAVYNDEFEKFSPPEITRRPVDDLILQMKDMNIDKVVNFPFPTPPDLDALKAAESLLISLGALERPAQGKRLKQAKKEAGSSKITPLGRAMACFPVSPRYGKMLSLGHQHDLLPYVIALVAALSVQELFTEIDTPPSTEQEKEASKSRRTKLSHIKKTWAGTGHAVLLGDLMVLLKAVGACEYEGCDPLFCQEHGVRYKAILEIRKLRQQLTNSVNSVLQDAGLVLDPKMSPPNDLQAKLLRQIALAGLGDHVARRMPDPLPGSEDAKKLKHAYQSLSLEEPVFIHPNSVLYRQKAEYVVYQSIDETSKLYIKGVSVFEPEWLPLFVPGQCLFSKPLEDPSPKYDIKAGRVVCHMTSTFGPHFWPLPAVELQFPLGIEMYKLFAKFFLEGSVFPKLKKYAATLLSAPVTMTKTWAKLQPRTETLLKSLVSESADCKERIVKIWEHNPTYLLNAYCEWLPEVLHPDIVKLWPPIS